MKFTWTRLDKNIWQCDQSEHIILLNGADGESDSYCVCDNMEAVHLVSPCFHGTMKACRDWVEEELRSKGP